MPDEDTPPEARTLRVSRSLTLSLSEIRWRATTSGGPGGQHANKTSSRVEVWFEVNRSGALGPRQRARLLERIGPVVRASASDDRSQARNRALALDRLAARLADALHIDAPRRPTRPSKGAKERRLEGKRQRGDIKRLRQTRGSLDD